MDRVRGSPHDTIFTKHQAFAPSGPMLLPCKIRFVRLEFCCKASARACQETHDLRNTMKHQAGIPGIQKETRNIILHYFVICLTSLSNSCALTLPLPFFTPSPLMTPSSPNTKPSSLQGRCCLSPKSGTSGWSSVSGPRPEPGRRHMIWETRWSTQHTRSIKLQNVFTVVFVCQIGQHHHLLSPTGKKTLLFWTPRFWTLGVCVPPKNISKLYSTIKTVLKIRLETEYLHKDSPRRFYRPKSVTWNPGTWFLRTHQDHAANMCPFLAGASNGFAWS